MQARAAKPPAHSGALQLVRETPTRELGMRRPTTLASDGRRSTDPTLHIEWHL